MLKMKLKLYVFIVTLFLVGTNQCLAQSSNLNILSAYANIAFENYSDTLNDAKALEKAVEAFIESPSQEGLESTKKAWLKARESYGQTEIFRLSNGPIDAEKGWVADAYGALEGQLNAWPLDENIIDYTIDAKGKITFGNIIDTEGMFDPGGEESKAVDVKKISIASLAALNENGGDANVASGYHAVEFLLWGQDQDYASFVKDSVTSGATTAGQRPLTDYTTDKDAQRRKVYLRQATKKIVVDLAMVNSAWSKKISSDCSKNFEGCYRGALLSALKGKDANKNIDANVALKDIFGGMGVFIKSELANERIAVAVLTPSEEDEHSCFSDNTHRDIAMNYQGFKNILTGTYNGKDYSGSLLNALDTKSNEKVTKLMTKIEENIEKIDTLAKTTEHFDYQIRPDNSNAKRIVKLKNDMRKLGDMMMVIAKAHNINLNIEDVTDAEETQL